MLLVLCYLSMLVASLFFVIWFYREYTNLHRVVPYAQYKKSWAIWSWFVPLLHLWRPYKIMKELYSEGVKESEKKENELAVWWTLWIILNGMARGVDKIGDLFDGCWFLIMAIDAILLVKIVRKIDVRGNKEIGKES